MGLTAQWNVPTLWIQMALLGVFLLGFFPVKIPVSGKADSSDIPGDIFKDQGRKKAER